MFILNWNEPYMPLLPSRRASPHFDRYSFFVPLRDWVGLSDCEWLVKAKFHYAIQLAISSLAGRRPACEPASELDGVMEFSIYKSRWFTRPKTVTHPSTNRARRRATSLIESNALSLSQAAILKVNVACRISKRSLLTTFWNSNALVSGVTMLWETDIQQ